MANYKRGPKYHAGTYTGDMLNGEPHGVGVLNYDNGDVHKGHYKDGKRHGPGVYIFTDGAVERGVWDKGFIVEIHTLKRSANK